MTKRRLSPTVNAPRSISQTIVYSRENFEIIISRVAHLDCRCDSRVRGRIFRKRVRMSREIREKPVGGHVRTTS